MAQSMNAAGPLDRLVQFRRLSLAPGPFGQVETWADYGLPHPAAKRDMTDGERWRAGEVQAHVTTRFVVRWSPFTSAIVPQDRLTCDDREYEIVGVKEGEGRRQWVEITCAARNDASPVPVEFADEFAVEFS
jgi:SPP1 family predicted phage head-tail adaptor